MRKSNRALRVLSEGNQALIRATEERGLLEVICRKVVEAGGYRFAWVGLADEDDAKAVRPAAWAGHEAGYLDSVSVTWADTERGHDPVGASIRTGQPCVVRDVPGDAGFAPWRSEAVRRGWASIMALPLIADGRSFGALAIYAVEPDAFDTGEVTLLTELADDLAYGVLALRTRAERARMSEELERQREVRYQSEKLAAMGQLLAGVAHELNNPLSVVLGRAALLRAAAEGGPLASQAEKIATAAQRCARIVKNFLALARQHPTERQPLGLNQVVEEAVELLAYQLRLDNVEVRWDLDRHLPILWADPHQLHQVAVNLISNAHQALREVATPRRLTLTTRFDPGRARILLRVADTGPGIPPDIRARIFEPFFTTKPLGQGTGLGLSLCQGIIEEHGGAITGESQPGQGAVFLVELPVETRPAVARKAPAAEAASPVRGKTILVVDDESEVAAVLAAILAIDGHQVETVGSGLVALGRLEQQAYDIVMSDIKMPGLDGPGLYRAVERCDPQLLKRCIFLTGDALSEDTRAFLMKTSVPTLGKPFALPEVRAIVQRVLQAQGTPGDRAARYQEVSGGSGDDPNG